MRQSPTVELRGVTRAFGPLRAVCEASFAVPQGALLSLLGPSGCGKTTTLRLIAGLERPDAGSVWIDGACVAGPRAWVEPEQRRVGVVFQDGALFPHLSVAENIAFPLTGLSHGVRQQRVAELLALVGLAGLERRHPHQLSGGQRQRVALARALAPRPGLILLDEPFASLDPSLRRELREEVSSILRASGTTTVLVTHDREEALSLSDLVAVMFDGRVAQVDTPRTLYERPLSRALGCFVGEANIIPAEASGQLARSALGCLPLAAPAHGPVELLIRPESLELCADEEGQAEIAWSRYFGHELLLGLRVEGLPELKARVAARLDLRPGQRVSVRPSAPALAWSRA